MSINRMNRLLKVACVLLAVYFASPVWGQTGQKLIINNFISDPAELETHLVISDVDGVGPNVKVSIFNEDGRLVYETFETLHAFGKLNYNPSDYLQKFQHGFNQRPIFNGSIKIESQGGNIAGQYWQFYKNHDMSYRDIAVPAANGLGYDKLVCQHFVSDKGIDSKIIVANAESTRPVTIMVKYYSDAGGLIASERVVVQANGMITLNPHKATKGLKLTGTAYLEVIGNGKVTGEYWQLSEKEKYQIALPLEGVTKIR